VILLLVSPDFIASDYCWDVEMTVAMERHQAGDAFVIPVILEAVLWEDAPFAKLEVLPEGALPVTSWPNLNEAFKSVAEGVKEAAVRVPVRPKRVSRISPSRNSAFVGRDRELETLCLLLEDEWIVAVTGRGGVGKSQLAAEHCYRSGDRYDLVWWLRAEDPATITIDLAELAGELGLPEARAESRADAVAAALARLAEIEGWLLVFDNARSWGEVEPYLPNAPGGCVLLTSQSAEWPVATLPLGVLPAESARQYLLLRTGQQDEAAAAGVAAAAEELPLALALAADYVEATGSSLGDYPAAEANAGVALALKAVADETPAAADLLRLAAFLSPDDIPLDLLTSRSARAGAVDRRGVLRARASGGRDRRQQPRARATEAG
jgi:hypothetical protein